MLHPIVILPIVLFFWFHLLHRQYGAESATPTPDRFHNRVLDLCLSATQGVAFIAIIELLVIVKIIDLRFLFGMIAFYYTGLAVYFSNQAITEMKNLVEADRWTFGREYDLALVFTPISPLLLAALYSGTNAF